MNILVPVDGSDCSIRALKKGIEFALEFNGTIQVVHYTDVTNDTTEVIRNRVNQELSEAGFEKELEVVTDTRLSQMKPSNRVGHNILDLVAGRNIDHIVMGHHGTGIVGSALLGSAAETVVEGSSIPVTVVP